MLEAINKAEDSFTGARYNVLRVVAAYPLDVNFVGSLEVQDALNEDNHPLASLEHAPLLFALTRSDARPSVLSSLSVSLKRIRSEGNVKDEVQQHISKSRKTSRRTSARISRGTSAGTSAGTSSRGLGEGRPSN